jgi:hypothetical protein
MSERLSTTLGGTLIHARSSSEAQLHCTVALLLTPGRAKVRWELRAASCERSPRAARARVARLLTTDNLDVAAGVTGDLRPYRLRGSFVSLLLWEGRSLAYVAEQAGHSIATLAKHYAGVIRELEDKPRVPADEAIRNARDAQRTQSEGRTIRE